MPYEYKRWLFNVPINSNFSFSDDSNGDGLSDGLSDVYGDHSKTAEGIRFHIQTTNGEFYLEQEIDNTKDYRIYFDYKTIGDVNILIERYDALDELIDIWKNEVINSSTWNYEQYDYEQDSEAVKIRIYFSCGTGSELYLDNLAIIENLVNIRVNPTEFSYELKSKTEIIENIDNNIQCIEEIKNKHTIENLQPIWGYIDYTQKTELDAMIDKKVLIRTHDRQVFTAIILMIGYTYHEQQLELEQCYEIKIELQYF